MQPWHTAAGTLIRTPLQFEFSGYDFNKLTLVGHSNGGDISGWLFNEGVDFAETLITLDHRRVPLPRAGSPFILSIRGSDYPADKGVLYSEQEKAMVNACIVKVANSKHNDMTDFGPDWLKASISSTLMSFISGQCHGAEKAQ